MQQYDENDIKVRLKVEFGIEAVDVKFMGNGYDSEAYLINQDFIFKFAKHKLACTNYSKEKKILDFLKDNLKVDVSFPQIEYFSKSEEMAIMGYRAINGIFLSLEIYQKMDEKQKEKLAQDIANFLKELHGLNIADIMEVTSDSKVGCLEDLEILKSNVYNKLNEKEKKFIESIFEKILKHDKFFSGKRCLCHNDLSSNHILLNENYELVGIIDFGDSCVIEEYCDFLYLLEEDEEEIGREFGLKILEYYGLKEIKTVLEYADLKAEYYPIETLVYGIKNNSRELWGEGLKLLKEKVN